jgi:hypothetical protein
MNVTISPTELSILNFDENFSAATRATLIASDTEMQNLFTIPTESAQMAEQSGEIVFETGEALNWGIRPDTGAQVNDHYAASMRITLRTNRQDTGPGLSAGVLSRHNEIASKVCAILQVQHSPYADMTPNSYYSVKFIRPAGRRHFIDWDFWQDVTELSFALEFSIQPSAWA